MQYTKTQAWVLQNFFPWVLVDQLSQGSVFKKQSFALKIQKSKQTPVNGSNISQSELTGKGRVMVNKAPSFVNTSMQSS